MMPKVFSIRTKLYSCYTLFVICQQSKIAQKLPVDSLLRLVQSMLTRAVSLVV